jgi:hypothetical protein
MNDSDNNFPRDEGASIEDDLRKLASLLERETYPGRAWQAPRRTPVVLRILTATAAAAAILLLSVVLLHGPTVTPQQMPLAEAPAAEPTAPFTWTAPADLDASYATTDSFVVPSFSFAPVGDAGAGEWVIPSFAGMSPTGSTNDDS